MKNSIRISVSVFLLGIIFSQCTHDKIGITNINFSSAYVVNAKDNSISVINLETGKIEQTISLPGASYPYHIYLSRDKKTLAVSVTGRDMSAGFPASDYSSFGTGCKVLLIDAVTGTIIKELPLTQLVSNAIFSPDAAELWVGQAGETKSKIQIYKTSDWSLDTTFFIGKGLAEITFCSDGDMSFTATAGDDSIQMYVVGDKSFLMNSEVVKKPTGAWPSDHHTDFITCEDNDMLYEINADDCSLITTVNLGFKPSHAIYQSANSELWVSDVTDGRVAWFTHLGTDWVQQGTINVGANPRWMAFNKSQSKAYVANQNANSVSVIDVATHSVTSTINVGQSPSCIAIKEE